MTTVEAINFLIQGVEHGRKMGIYSFQDCATIHAAIETLKNGTSGKTPAQGAPEQEERSSKPEVSPETAEPSPKAKSKA